MLFITEVFPRELYPGSQRQRVNQRAARLNLVLVFYRAWPLKGQFLCKQLCVPVLKADRKVQNRVVRGVGQLGRDGGFNRQSSLKVYKS